MDHIFFFVHFVLILNLFILPIVCKRKSLKEHCLIPQKESVSLHFLPVHHLEDPIIGLVYSKVKCIDF